MALGIVWLSWRRQAAHILHQGRKTKWHGGNDEVRGAGGTQALNEGDVITRINRVPVATLVDFQRVIDTLKPGDGIVLNLSRYDHRARRVVQRIVQFSYE